MKYLIHKVLLMIFAILPIAFGTMTIILKLYHDGYYIAAEIRYGEGFAFQNEFPFESSTVVGDKELKIEGNEIIVWGPPPPEIEANIAFTEYHLFARQVKIFFDSLLDPYMNTKLFMKALDENMTYYGIVITVSETIFNVISRKYEKRTVLHVYKIDMIVVKIIKYTRRERTKPARSKISHT